LRSPAVIVAAVHAVDRDQPVSDVTTLAALRGRSFAQAGFGAALGSALALLALALTAVGVYGLYAFAVAQRRREVGVRLAVGGTPGRVLRMILADGMKTAVAGLCLGLPSAVLAARWVRGSVPGVAAVDVDTLCVAAAVMLVVALLACWIPARRASRVDPSVVLRADG
jgi:putative ABC transport system permease protein